MDLEVTMASENETLFNVQFSRRTLELLNTLLCSQQIPVGNPVFEEAALSTITAKRELIAALQISAPPAQPG